VRKNVQVGQAEAKIGPVIRACQWYIFFM